MYWLRSILGLTLITLAFIAVPFGLSSLPVVGTPTDKQIADGKKHHRHFYSYRPYNRGAVYYRTSPYYYNRVHYYGSPYYYYYYDDPYYYYPYDNYYYDNGGSFYFRVGF